MIEEVTKIFNDINRAIIEMGGDIDNCTPPDKYAEAIRSLSGNNAVLCIPVFRSSAVKPATPTKQMSANNPKDYPDGGGTPDNLPDGNIGMSYCIVGPQTTYVPGTEPLLVKGKEQETASGDDATTRTFIICLELPDLSITPDTPIGGTGNVEGNALVDCPTFTYNGITYEWSTDNNHVQGCYTGMSVGTFLAKDGSQVETWSTPICINGVRDGKDGKPGRNGEDGEEIEFIYKLCQNEAEAKDVATPESPENEDDYIPEPRYDVIGPGGWSDSPQGVDSVKWHVEIMCTRKKNINKETGEKAGGPFTGPVIWSSGGEDGMDGDGVEYIFRVATEGEYYEDPEKEGVYHLNTQFWPPTCGEGCASALVTVAMTEAGVTEQEALAVYQQDEFIPGGSIGESIGWDRNGTDDPLDVGPEKPFEFCSIRRYDGQTKTGGGFSEPVLWNKYYGATSGVFTSFAFTRSRLKLGSLPLTGGTVGNPLPDSKGWPQDNPTEKIVGFDSVPDASEYEHAHDEDPDVDKTLATAPVGMTTRIFGSIIETPTEATTGTSPQLMSDNRFFNVEYSASTIDPSDQDFHLPRFDETPDGSETEQPFINLNDPEGVDEDAWRTYCSTHVNPVLGVGGDENNIQDPIGMATCQFVNGKGTDGAITRIKGEDGQRGVDGSGTEYVYIRTTGDSAPTIISSDDTFDGKTYLDDDYLPLSSAGRCTDNPSGVNDTYQYEGIAERTKSQPNSSGIRTGNMYSGTMVLGAKGGGQGPQGPPGSPGGQGPRGYTGARYRQSIGKPGVQYYQGADQETYYDVVIYEPDGKLYLCVQSHVSQNNIVPGTNTSYGAEATNFDFVATKLLLSENIKANLIESDNLVVKKVFTGYAGQDTNVVSIQGNTIDLAGEDINNVKTSLILSASDIADTSISGSISYRFTANATLITSSSEYISQNGIMDISEKLLVLSVDPTASNMLILPTISQPLVSVNVSNFSGSGYITVDPEIFWYKNYEGDNPVSLSGGASLSSTIYVNSNGTVSAVGSNIIGTTCSITEKFNSNTSNGEIDLVLIATIQSFNASADITVSVINGSTEVTASGTYLSQATLFGTNGIIVKFDSNTYMYAYRPPIYTNGIITGYDNPKFEMKAGNAAIRVSNGKIGITDDGSTYYKPQLSGTVVTG